ncbi:MAG: hypothetical protein R3B84_12345 [Zavarzinella sp.]
MSIPITCPSCRVNFEVEDHYAGMEGRCPSCMTVIHVPGTQFELELELPREEILWQSKSRELPPPIPQNNKRRPTEPPAPRKEDLAARAAKWDRVAIGFRNIVISGGLIFGGGLVLGAFLILERENLLVENHDPGRNIALLIGGCVLMGLSFLLWGTGRGKHFQVPYRPAKSTGSITSIFAALTAFGGVGSFASMVGGGLILQQNLQAGAMLMAMGIMGAAMAFPCFGITECIALYYQIQVGRGLRTESVRRSTMWTVRILIFLGVFQVIAFIAAMAVVAAEGEKQKREFERMQQQQEQNVFQQNRDEDDDDPKAEKEVPPNNNRPKINNNQQNQPPRFRRGGANNAAVNNQNNNNNQNNQNFQNNQNPPEPTKKARHAMAFWLLSLTGSFWVYGLLMATSAQTCRREILREIYRLTADPEDPDYQMLAPR